MALAREMLAVAETSGQMDLHLKKCADYHLKEANQAVRIPPSRFVRQRIVPGGFDVADAEIVAQIERLSLAPYQIDPPAADGRKVILTDTDHLWGIGGDVAWVWKSFLRGLNPIFMDPYTRVETTDAQGKKRTTWTDHLASPPKGLPTSSTGTPWSRRKSRRTAWATCRPWGLRWERRTT